MSVKSYRPIGCGPWDFYPSRPVPRKALRVPKFPDPTIRDNLRDTLVSYYGVRIRQAPNKTQLCLVPVRMLNAPTAQGEKRVLSAREMDHMIKRLSRPTTSSSYKSHVITPRMKDWYLDGESLQWCNIDMFRDDKKCLFTPLGAARTVKFI